MLLMAIYASLMSLALGLFTSMTFVALTHIFIIIPCFYFIPKTNFKAWNKSAWFLLGLILAVIVSIIVNQDIMDGFQSITKAKYYLIALLSIAPYSYWWKTISKAPEDEKQKKIKWLLWALVITTTLASLSGMSAVFFGYNVLKLKAGFVERNGGLAGMLMNYAQNMAFFLVIISGLILNREEIKKYINPKLLYGAWFINLIGLYTTYTRGAWLAFLVALPFFFFKKNVKLFTMSFIILIIVGFGAYKLAGKSVVRPDSEVERISQWKAAIAGFKERPIFGLGYLNFEKLSKPLKKKYNLEAPYFGGHAHSNYFEMLASTGLVGFFFFMLWQIFWFVEMFKRDDLVGKIAMPFIVVFAVAGVTQATFVIGASLIFIMPVYALTQVQADVFKKDF